MRIAIRLLSLALPLLAAAWLLVSSTTEASGVYTRSVELDGGERAAVFPLPTTAGDSWTLWIDGTERAVSLELLDPRSGRAAARTGFGRGGMHWTAPQTGVWSVRASIVATAKPVRLRLFARRQIDGEGHPARPTAVALRGGDPATAQGAINWAGDADWFAVGMSARNSYTIYTVLGTLNATRGDILLPGDDAPTPLPLHSNGKTLFRTVSPEADGAALIRIAGLGEGVGSYVLGVTPRGDAPHPPVPTAAAPVIEEDRLRGARATAEPGELVFELLGEWGALDAAHRVGVWLDTDADRRWDFALITRDGWEARLWSVEERRWLAGATRVGSRGFNSLILRTSARGFDGRVRWQAAAHHPGQGWRAGAAGVLEPRLAELVRAPGTVPAVPARERTHTVVAGDSLTAIAQQYGLSLDELRALNPSATDTIHKGEVLHLGGTQPPPVVSSELTVQNSDYVQYVAAELGVLPHTLIANNGLSAEDWISAGTVLRAPHREGLLVTVQRGDTLQGIARRHGVELSAILADPAHGVVDANEIVIGQEIILPLEMPAFHWPAVGALTDGFGPCRNWDCSYRHRGLDVAVDMWAPITASADGLVTFVGGDPCCGLGLYVEIEHPGGWTTIYAHLTEFAVWQGQLVQRGETIGYNGSTGMSTGPHLHFEVHHHDWYIDPLVVLP